MIDTPHILQVEQQRVAIIHLVIRREEMPSVMGAAVNDLIQAISGQEAGPTGPLFTHHLKRPGDMFDLEVGFPVSRPIAPVGRVQPGLLPAATVARTVYHGGYQGLGAAWGEFMQWLEANGHQSAQNLWERYLSGPADEPEQSLWRTELNQPLLGAG